MNLSTSLLVLILLSSLIPGLVILVLREQSVGLRTTLNLFGAMTKLLLVGIMIWGVFSGHVFETRWTLAPGLDMVLHADELSVLFVTLSTVLWLVTTIYAVGYLENTPHRSRFFGFFSLCVTATVGLALAGLGVKAALVPLHGWLPHAMVAPAPVSALLHVVAVVKAGAFGIVRVVYDVFGVEFLDSLHMLPLLGALAGFTIIYGSVRALSQDVLKKRLAYSTISQVSYIALGTAIVGPLATIGGVVHLVHQGIMKITLFFAAGNYDENLGVQRVSQMDGVGKRMPVTTLAFTIGALGMIGIPPIVGFFSKWYLSLGAIEAGQAFWVIPVLIGSSLLNAGYFLPILYRAWFKSPPRAWPAEHPRSGRLEMQGALLWPPVITATLALAAGLFAAAPNSPLEWAQMIATSEYRE